MSLFYSYEELETKHTKWFRKHVWGAWPT